mgnify:CR=1 FL=1
MLGEVEGSGGVVAPRAGNDLHPVVNPLDAEGHGGDVLPNGSWWQTRRSAQTQMASTAAGDLRIDETAEGGHS